MVSIFFLDSLALIVVDFSQPWEIVKSIKKWLNVLEQHCNSIKVNDFYYCHFLFLKLNTVLIISSF